jgi:hypothetical protein
MFLIAGVVAEGHDPVVICTVTDPEKWKTAAAVKPGEGNLLTDENGSMHFALDGNVLMICPDVEPLKQAVQGGGRVLERLGDKATDALGGNDVVVWIDAAGLQKEIGEGIGEFEEAITSGMGGAGPQAAGMTEFMKWGAARLRTLAADTQSITILGRISGDGVHLAKHVAMKPDGEAATYLKKIKRNDKDLLRGLVDSRPAISFGCEWELPPDTPSLTRMFMSAMLDAAKPAEGGEDLKARAARALAMIDATTGFSGGASATEAGKLVASTVYFTSDPKAVLENFAAYQEVNQQVTAGLIPGVKLEVKPSQEQIGGVQASVYEIVMTSDDPSVTAPLEALYGGPVTVAAAAHGPGVVMGMGAAAAAKAQLEKLVASGAAPLSANAHVKAALGTITAAPQMCVLIDLPRLSQLGVGMASGMGLPLPPIKFPEAASPLIAMGVYLQDTTVSSELHIPAGAIKPIVETVKATMNPPAQDSQ